MASSASELLNSVNAAIAAVLAGGQSYTLVDGTQVSQADLDKLRALRTELQQEVDAEAGSSITLVNTRFRSTP